MQANTFAEVVNGWVGPEHVDGVPLNAIRIDSPGSNLSVPWFAKPLILPVAGL